MLKKILSSVGVNSPLHIPDVPDIAYLTNISTASASKKTHPPTYEHLHGPLLTKISLRKTGSILEILDLAY